MPAHNTVMNLQDDHASENNADICMFFNEAPVGLIFLNDSGSVGRINRQARQIFDVPDDDCDGPPDGLHVSKLFPSLRVSTLEEFCRIFSKRQQAGNADAIEINGVRTDGGKVPLEVRARWFGGEKTTGCVLTVYDISASQEAIKEQQKRQQSLEFNVRVRTVELAEKVRERDNAQKKLKQSIIKLQQQTSAREASEARMRAILDTAADGIITIDEDGVILSFNRAAEAIFQRNATDTIGKNVSLLMSDEEANNHGAFIGNYRHTGDPKIIGIGRELEGKRRDGAVFPMELSVSETKTDGNVTYTGIVRDISERRENEEMLLLTLSKLKNTQSSLIESEKMASLGNLVAGVAHEINTPIGVAVTAASHLREIATAFVSCYEGGKMTRKDLEVFTGSCGQSSEILETNLHRASDLIRSFKQVAVDQSDDSVREIGLLDYLNEVVLSLRPKLKNTSVRVSVDIASDLKVTHNPGAISQIVTNLITNSLIHGFEDWDGGSISLVSRIDGDSVILEYKDDGKGMDEETARQVFEPFFTTKRGSGGSGLGMHILYNLVTQSLGGEVSCSSSPGEGVLFTIAFPRTASSA